MREGRQRERLDRASRGARHSRRMGHAKGSVALSRLALPIYASRRPRPMWYGLRLAAQGAAALIRFSSMVAFATLVRCRRSDSRMSTRPFSCTTSIRSFRSAARCCTGGEVRTARVAKEHIRTLRSGTMPCSACTLSPSSALKPAALEVAKLGHWTFDQALRDAMDDPS